MYKDILVPISVVNAADAARALQVAEKLRTHDGTITVMHVIERIPEHVRFSLPSSHFGETKENVRVQLENLVGSMANVRIDVIDGHSGRAILDHAKKNKADCIVVGSHRPGLEDYFLGSTAAHVVRHAICSVHVVR